MVIGGTGHRPHHLPCKYNEEHPWCTQLKLDVSTWLKKNKPDAVISGMALGWDTWIAEAALELKIPLYAYLPYKDQGSNWLEGAKIRLQGILDEATEIKIASEEYRKDCFLKRDKMIVEASDYMICLLKPWSEHSGTKYTMDYALSKGLPFTNFWRD